MELPKDPMMLFSFINTKLRDFYPSLDALCKDMNVKKRRHHQPAEVRRIRIQPRTEQVLVRLISRY